MHDKEEKNGWGVVNRQEAEEEGGRGVEQMLGRVAI